MFRKLKKIVLVTLLVLSPLAGGAVTRTINPVIGDISFVEKFGEQPTAVTDEDLRIKTHLRYVENLLRKKDVSHIPLALQQRRAQALDLLHEYWSAGIYPRNYDYPDSRVPCFIDKDGKICAVGYLIEKTAGRAVAEKINSKHKYKKMMEMNDELVDAWIASSGLTKEECAMIQPTYGTLPVLTANWNPVFVVSGPSEEELRLAALVDSLQPVHEALKLERDSLSQVITNKTGVVDSLEQVAQLNQEEIAALKTKFEAATDKSRWIITALACLIGLLLSLIGLIFLRRKKPLYLQT